MVEASRCPACGCELPPDSPAGLCPDCLLGAGLESSDEVLEQGSAFAQTTPQPGAFVPPEPETLAGLFPQLEVLELLGHGGMGAVYKARQTNLDRLVALKIIRPESADDPTFAERFTREARTLARLSHPNIVAVHDFGEAGGLFYIVMEYVDGLNLRQMYDGGRLSPDEVLAIIPQICEALQFAHDEGIVHRDIKPENILLDQRGRVKIADFGLAKLARPHLAPGESHLAPGDSPGAKYADFTLTGTHQVMGTPRYMAPEQMIGSHQVDHRADIYSLGVVFYEMLTGELPMGRFEPPSKKASVDVRLDEIVMRALAREPERRFQQASEIKSSVELISSHPGDFAMADSLVGKPPVPPSTGISTIAEREVRNAWRWVAGDSGETVEQRPTLPALLMIVLSIAGCLMLLLPWLHLQIDQNTDLRVQDWQLQHSVSQTLSGTDRWPGVATSVAFGLLALLLIVTPGSRPLTWKRPALMTAIAAFAVWHTLLFKIDLVNSSYTVPIISYEIGNGGTYDAPDGTSDVSSDVRDASEQKAKPVRSMGSVQLYKIDHRITYQVGFYGSLGLSLSLLLLSAVGIRNAVSQQGESEQGSSPSTDPPLTSLRFSVPAGEEIGPQVVFHFSGLGYRLVEEQSAGWVFERGKKLGGLWASDIRGLFTTLSVHTTAGKEGELLVACVWAVRTMGGWIGGRDIKKLEAEGHELQSLLVGGNDAESDESATNDTVNAEALRQVRGPAIGLLATSIVECVILIVGFVVIISILISTLD